MLEEEEFNFWPSFTDLMLSLVLILILILFLVTIILKAGSENLEKVKENQKKISDAVAQAYNTIPQQNLDNEFVIYIDKTKNTKNSIIISNFPTLQKITFSENILFDSNQSKLKCRGEETLRVLVKILKTQLSLIQQIQIHGHTDTKGDRDFDETLNARDFNMRLGADRAIEVFYFLKDAGIDPNNKLMSITSFGPYKPVGRDEDAQYNHKKIEEENIFPEQKNKNRRIELLLFYSNKLEIK